MSYAEGTVYYASDDESTAKDLLQAVLKFYEIFPEFKSNRFFVAGLFERFRNSKGRCF